ncbi:MAG TPA: D-alanyl-D-alanine carboxypeptidase/D-alanyl-D-alanine-endopeptidase, partial [Candidatus Baltobacteraceae bacterium]|nr:D-alanyl-D-alanine carboxypeptidase/D-alanyl-D-alanine-endopeptidase [Candidatus Baltobacteraceae bacterium]
GTIAGNLWLVGSGDPSFRSDDLRRGVDALARAGVRTIAGGIRVDASAMRGPEINPHWNPADAGEDYDAPTSGMSIDEDTAEFRVYGGAPGTAARVVVVPHSSALRVSGEIVSGGGDNVIIAPQGTPNVFALSGSIPAQTEEKFWLPVHGIPAYAGNVLAAMLREASIRTAGPPDVQPAPLDSVALWDHRSAALTDLIARMLFVSDNHYAEQLLRTVGGDVSGAPDDAGGIAAEEAFLRRQGIPTHGFHVVDGSGLAEVDRVSAMTLARVLTDAHLYRLLPQGGRDGTLKHYDFTTALGRVRAKTGHLSDAASLAGYVNTMRHGRIVFAFMINDSPGDPDAAYVRAVDLLAKM